MVNNNWSAIRFGLATREGYAIFKLHPETEVADGVHSLTRLFNQDGQISPGSIRIHKQPSNSELDALSPCSQAAPHPTNRPMAWTLASGSQMQCDIRHF